MKIRILHLVLSLDTGGLENGVVNIINGLDSDKFESVLCCIKHKGELAERLQTNVKVIELNHYAGLNIPVIYNLINIIRNENIDVIHTRNYKSYLFGFLAGKILMGKHLVHSEHGKDYPFNTVKMFIHRIMSIFTDHTIALSEDLKYNMIRYMKIKPSRINVIINGVDTNKFSPGPKDLKLINEFGIMDDTITIGAIGRIVEIKNYPELIYAVKQLVEKKYNIKLLIVGDGPLLEEMKSLVNSIGLESYVNFAGRRNDIPDILRLLDIYALTSFNEGISNTLLEAMSSCNPVIASKVGGNAEIVIDGEVGFTYSSGEKTELVEKMSLLIDDEMLRKELALKAREHVLKNYSLDTMIENYSILYSSCVTYR